MNVHQVCTVKILALTVIATITISIRVRNTEEYCIIVKTTL